MRHRIGPVLALVGLLVIAVTTLIPLPQQIAASRATSLWCLVCGDYGGVDVVNNLLLFIPFAAGLRLSGVGTAAVVAAGSLVSLSVESLQWAGIPGRDASLSDLLTNTGGSWLGAVLGAELTSIIYPAPKPAIRFAGLTALVWLMVQAASAFLLRPWVPGGELRGAWARSIPGRETFDGMVVSASISGSPLPGTSTLADRELRSKIREGPFRLEVDLRAGWKTPKWVPVVELLGAHGPVLSLDAVGKSLAFQPPMRSYSLRLRRPGLGLPGALPATAGARLQLAAGRRHDTLWAVWTAGTGTRVALQALSPSFGWSLLTPSRYAYGPEVRTLTGIWIAGWLALISYWSAGSGRPGRLAGVLLLLPVGLGFIPWLTGYPAVHWSEWLAGAAGIGVGWAGHRSAAYLQGRCDSPSNKESC
jgi:VanZ like family